MTPAKLGMLAHAHIKANDPDAKTEQPRPEGGLSAFAALQQK